MNDLFLFDLFLDLSVQRYELTVTMCPGIAGAFGMSTLPSQDLHPKSSNILSRSADASNEAGCQVLHCIQLRIVPGGLVENDVGRWEEIHPPMAVGPSTDGCCRKYGLPNINPCRISASRHTSGRSLTSHAAPVAISPTGGVAIQRCSPGIGFGFRDLAFANSCFGFG